MENLSKMLLHFVDYFHSFGCRTGFPESPFSGKSSRHLALNFSVPVRLGCTDLEKEEEEEEEEEEKEERKPRRKQG